MAVVTTPPTQAASQAPPQTPPAAAIRLGDAVLVRLPDRLADLPRSVLLTGTVLGQTREGATRVRTQAGEVVLRGSGALPADGTVTLQIAAGRPPRTALLFGKPATPVAVETAGAAGQPTRPLSSPLSSVVAGSEGLGVSGAARVVPDASALALTQAASGRTAVPLTSGGAGLPDLPQFTALLQALMAANPAVAKQFIETKMPQATTKLSATLLAFLSAVRGNTAHGWLGAAADTLVQAGRHDVLSRMTEAFGRAARQAADTPANEWRAFSVPFLEGGQMQALRFAVRTVGDEDGTGDAPTARGTRFLIDVVLSRLGSLQFDGLVRKPQFDLILRSSQPLPDALRGELLEAYGGILQALGLTGSLAFQPHRPGWQGVPPATPQTPNDLGTA